jgi:hypothetical protein
MTPVGFLAGYRGHIRTDQTPDWSSEVPAAAALAGSFSVDVRARPRRSLK